MGYSQVRAYTPRCTPAATHTALLPPLAPALFLHQDSAPLFFCVVAWVIMCWVSVLFFVF